MKYMVTITIKRSLRTGNQIDS